MHLLGRKDLHRAELKYCWEKEKHIDSLYLFVHVSKHSVISLSCLIKLILNRLWFRGKKEHQVFLTVLNHSSWLKKDSLYIQTGLSYLNLREEKAFILSNGWSVFFYNPS